MVYRIRQQFFRQGSVGDSAPAFTLSELLITIAIIALLGSILVAAVNRAKDLANLTLCKTHLHSIGRGLSMYASEHNQFLPLSDQPMNPHEKLLDTMVEYVESREIFYCPSVTDPDMMLTPENIAAGRISYFYYSCENPAPITSYTSKTLRNFGGVTPNWPRHIKMDMSPETWVMSDCWIAGEGVHPYGNKGMNYLTLTGAVEMLETQPSSVFR